MARGYSTPLFTATATDPNGTKNYVPADKTFLVVVKLHLYKSSAFVENEVHKYESWRYKIAKEYHGVRCRGSRQNIHDAATVARTRTQQEALVRVVNTIQLVILFEYAR